MRICVSIAARDTAEALNKMARAETLADVIELRLDLMESFDMKQLVGSTTKPILAAYRTKGQGGAGNEEAAGPCLMEAVEAGANFVDVEWGLPPGYREAIMKHPGRPRIVLSNHILDRTPPFAELRRLLEEMTDGGPDLVKIVPRAGKWEDNFQVLKLIPLALATHREIIAFCMGPLGRVSRILCPLMGGYMTFAALDSGEESAPGQIPASDMRRVWRIMSP
ncbi:MAG: type I 3-dehydroquinate dehydratase [Deltaproteobacteria bacterium]|nr:type I 3-dehydroquinate dehydratase [Deltaproteobacteria bacterium]